MKFTFYLIRHNVIYWCEAGETQIQIPFNSLGDWELSLPLSLTNLLGLLLGMMWSSHICTLRSMEEWWNNNNGYWGSMISEISDDPIQYIIRLYSNYQGQWVPMYIYHSKIKASFLLHVLHSKALNKLSIHRYWVLYFWNAFYVRLPLKRACKDQLMKMQLNGCWLDL